MTHDNDRPVVTERPVTVLLIDDQAIVGESVRHMLAGEHDIVFHFCQDPAKAIATANEVPPTVILQDLVMPDIDGLMLVKFFRANKPTRETPMIVLSSKEEPIIKARAFALGANDYLVKLPDRIELIARIRYHSRAYINLLERNEAYRRLDESQRELAEEVAQAARYAESLLPVPLTGDVEIRWKFVPSTSLGGDMFGYHWLDADHLAVYLLDVSGHGVGSSLLAVSAANVLSAQSLPNTDFRQPAQVLTRLNDVFQMDRQDGKYFTIFYGVFDRQARVLRYSSGGHPAMLLYTGSAPESLTMQQLDSTDPLIGMLPPGIDFESREVALAPHARLFLYSDGVFEIHLPSGKVWDFADFVVCFNDLVAKHDSVLEPMLAHARQLHGADLLNDDFSLLEVRM
jgi:sigma-B regulation protein RsbU (phosphoserine phosphatase)